MPPEQPPKPPQSPEPLYSPTPPPSPQVQAEVQGPQWIQQQSSVRQTQAPQPQYPFGQAPLGGLVVPTIPRRKRRLLPLAILLAVLMGGAASAYYFYIAPSRPAGLWARALSNTSKGYDYLVDYSKDQEPIDDYKMSGSLKIQGEASGDATFSIHKATSATKVDFSAGLAGVRLKGEVRMLAVENSDAPDMYVKVEGIKSVLSLFDAPATSPYVTSLTALDNRWISFDHTLFDQVESMGGVTNTALEEFTKDDYVTIAKTVGRVNKDYLLSTNPDKAVLTVAQNVGDEDRDGRKTYHYKVGYRKDQLKAYVTALKDELKKTKLNDVFQGNLEQTVDFDSMLKSIDKMDGKGTADVWVDKSTKLIWAVRFADKDDQNTFMELGLHYTGGDNFPFVVGGQGGDIQYKLTTTYNKQSQNLAFDLQAESGESDGGQTKVTGSAKLERTEEDLKLEAPVGALPWTDAFAPYRQLLDTTLDMTDSSDSTPRIGI